ncbi:hypothetical protein [Streptomyces macrosporus]|uniref:Uncharacterized protein n=1 Tax=Streptomyces macrosporus TaxID=44032 RepID=A0ABN3KL92_9ACTN
MMSWEEVPRRAEGGDKSNKGEFVAAMRSATIDTSRFDLVEGLPHAVFDVADTAGAFHPR